MARAWGIETSKYRTLFFPVFRDTTKPEIGSPGYGYGFGIEENGRVVGHGGGFPGISAQLDIFVEEDYTVAVLSNYGMGAPPVVEKARALILAGRAPTASQ
jgi:hypothetical protein